MEKKRYLSSEDNILKSALTFLGILSLLGIFMFQGLVRRNEIRLPEVASRFIIIFGFLTSLFCIVSNKVKVLRFTAVIFLSVFISLIGSFQQMNISLLFIIPVFLGYCFQSQRKAYALLYANIILFNLSRVLRAFNIYMSNPRIYLFRNILVSSIVMAIFESIVFLFIALPVFMLLVKKNEDLRKSLEEKNEATNDILQFCSTATSFHNKYLSVHIKGVRDITTVILDGLIKAGVYIEPNYYKQIVFSVQFHDIGKIYIDSSILDKKGSLNEGETFTLSEKDIYEKAYQNFELFL